VLMLSAPRKVTIDVDWDANRMDPCLSECVEPLLEDCAPGFITRFEAFGISNNAPHGCPCDR